MVDLVVVIVSRLLQIWLLLWDGDNKRDLCYSFVGCVTLDESRLAMFMFITVLVTLV